jgi:hypothetical protein
VSIPTEAFPLQWPNGRPRAKRRERAVFKVTMGRSLRDIQAEVRMLGGQNLVISTNMPLRMDGLPTTAKRIIADPGAAAYFVYKGRAVCFACDRWEALEDNLRAISLTINALRGIDRWGTGDMVAAAFTGFTALPAPAAEDLPHQVLGVDEHAAVQEIEYAYRRLAQQCHPDRGGSSAQMTRINTARDAMLRARGQ